MLSIPTTRRRAVTAVVGSTALALAAAGLVLGAGSAGAAPASLLTNGDLETGTLAGWTCSAGLGSVVTTPVHGGKYALAGAASSSDSAQCSQTVAVQPNTAYTLSGFVQGSYVYLGVTGSGADTSTWGSPASYTQLSTTFTTGASVKSVTVWVHGWYGQGTYYADDLTLSGPGGSTSPSTSPTTPASSTAPTTPASSASTTAPTGCADPAWVASTAYNGGARVSYNAHEWTAKWWTQGDIPGNNSQNVWTDAGACTGGSVPPSSSSPSSSPSTTVSTPPSSPSSSSTSTPPGTGKHLVTGYWQDFDNGATDQRISDVNGAYDIIAVSFATADPSSPGGITFSLDGTLASKLGGYTDAQFKADIAAKHAAGKKVVISVGGQNGTITVADSASATNFANSAWTLMQNYGFDGVDIDLENGINPTYMGQALHSLAAKKGAGFVLTMAPQTIDMLSTTSGYFALALNVKDVLTIVNTQYYNSGSMNGCNGGVYSQGSVDFITSQACTVLKGGLAPSQVGIGVPASSSAAGSGYVSPSVVNAALDCLAYGTSCGSFVPDTKWPGIGGAMTWSTNWDASAGNGFATVVGAHVHALP
jgi:chitinase